MPAASPDAEALWLETLQLVVGRAAHELKGALNGVSVNLEVVRGRAAQSELPASSVARFATSAATQLDQVIEMNEALLALARRGRDPADVGATLRALGALLAPAAAAAEAPLTVDATAEGLSGATVVPASAVRALLGRLLLALIDGGGGEVRLRDADGGIEVRGVASKGAVEIEERVAGAAAAAGVRAQAAGSTITFTFPGTAASLAHRGATTHGIA